MEKVCGIYKITSPSNRIYIGKSVNINKRFISYKNNHCKTQRRLYNSFINYGSGNHKFEIIHKCMPSELNRLEIFYIKLYNTFNSPNGLNLLSGGENSLMSEETKIKIGIGGKGRKCSEETKIRMSLAQKGNKNSLGRIVSADHSRKISESNKGRIFSDQHKIKISIALSGRKLSKDHIKNISKSHTGLKYNTKSKNNGK